MSEKVSETFYPLFVHLYFCTSRLLLHVRPVVGMPPALCCCVRMVSLGSLTFLIWIVWQDRLLYRGGSAV